MRAPDAKLEELDARLASLARDEAVLRLHLGQALEVLGRGALFELGFCSLAAYAVERCESSARWADDARRLARRVERLPALRNALVTGAVSWSMSELLARVAEPEDEVSWLEVAQGKTVRQVRVLVAEALRAARVARSAASAPATKDGAARADAPAPTASPREVSRDLGHDAASTDAGGGNAEGGDAGGGDAGGGDAGGGDAGGGDAGGGNADGGDAGGGDADDICTLVCTLDREEAWLFEATRQLLVQLGMYEAEEQCEALLAEAQATLLAALPAEAFELGRWQSAHVAQQRWSAELRRWRDEAEERCEENIRRGLAASGRALHRGGAREAWAWASMRGISALEHGTSTELDRLVRAIRGALARHELELSQRVLELHRADGWRQLGYATETQYARERLGISRSSFHARRWLALRLERLPLIGAALGSNQIGVEAAMQLVRVATPNTQAAWVEHARRRTIKHLKEDVAAALTAIRWSGESDCPPPEDRDVEVFHRLERAVVGAAHDRFQEEGAKTASRPRPSKKDTREASDAEPASDQRRAWDVMIGSLNAWLAAGGVRMSAVGTTPPEARSSAGRVTLRLRVSRATRAWWRELEALSRIGLPPTISWPRFLCACLWRSWRHLRDSGVAYAHVYTRDRYRCMSPVCNRRDVTPHHLKFRSAGGGDEAENIASVCTWCHLQGVHGGRIRASGTAACIHWEFGAMRPPCLVVHGRDRVAA